MTAVAATCMTSSNPSSSCASEYIVTAALIATSGNSASSTAIMPTTAVGEKFKFT